MDPDKHLGAKDNRYKNKRHNLDYDKKKRRFVQKQQHTTSSSSAMEDSARGVIDLVDSSDERRFVSRAINQSNWKSRPQREYDLPPDDSDDNPQLQAGDFRQLAQLPTEGAHFRFAAEREWEDEGALPISDMKMTLKFFNLNLKYMTAALSAIPFYKRMDYPASMFSAQQLTQMEQEAELAEKELQNINLQEPISETQIEIKSATSESAGKTSAGSKPKTPERKAAITTAELLNLPGEADPELDELLNMTSSDFTKINLAELTAEAEADLGMAGAGGSATKPGSTEEGLRMQQENLADVEDWLEEILKE